MQAAGYSGTPLGKKLGFKPGFIVKLVNAPSHYLGLFSDWPADIQLDDSDDITKDAIHYFVKDNSNLEATLVALRDEIKMNGMIWVSWPKKTSGVVSNVTENLIRELALKNGLVDIKVCAVDEIWSGLKLVIPVKDRNK